jgi:membrane-associated phospholipid phosphatase
MRPPKVFEGDPSIHIWHPHPPTRHSFPSGHATSIATGGIFFAWGFWQAGSLFQSMIAIFTVFLCFTRVIIGVHFPGDIFVGSMIGSIGAFLILRHLLPILEDKLGRMRKYAQGRPGWLIVGVALIAAISQILHQSGVF